MIDRPEVTQSRLNSFLAVVAAGCLLSASFAQAQTPPEDRHAPHNFKAESAMVVAAHPLAAQAGVAVLKAGGNAVDAAVATALALNAAEPFASGMGGGGFMVIYLAGSKRVTTLNFREKAPAAAFPEMFYENGRTNDTLRREHGLAVAVPGALAGYSYALKTYGTKSLGDALSGAVSIAETGYIVSPTFSKINKDEYEKLLLLSGESSCYLNEGFPFEPGETFRNPALARTFRLIADKGIEEFYTGSLAQKIVAAVKAKRGILTLEDLAGYKPVELPPLSGTYKGHTLYTIQPPGSGGLHLIQLLNIIESWPIQSWGHNSAPYIHHLSEAFRFVFADRARYLGDPEFEAVPVKELLSKSYASRIAGEIAPDRTRETYPFGRFDEKQHESGSTTHLCVIDKEGNIVSLTQSINHFFGSGIVPEDTGFLLNNHMDDFSRTTDSPNSPRPGRRPVSSMSPVILFKGEDPLLVMGSPGGTRIFPSLTQIILNIVDFGLSLDEAIEAPRFFSYSVEGEPRDISLESRISGPVIQALEKLGHKLQIREAFDKYFGGAQGLLVLSDRGLILGGADSRRDGFGAGY